jgi:hypothetical protein
MKELLSGRLITEYSIRALFQNFLLFGEFAGQLQNGSHIAVK